WWQDQQDPAGWRVHWRPPFTQMALLPKDACAADAGQGVHQLLVRLVLLAFPDGLALVVGGAVIRVVQRQSSYSRQPSSL
ncbi:hypothetical protein ACIRRH_42845, partial [Kitasatospora sp. NPDC101235]|uniref:hypothetical protein n=1 Tax=Kitasatospora sp. NPDC101235 TaxID=3364101 RepID=UPI003821AE04